MSELVIEGGVEQPVKSVLLLKRDIDMLLRVGLGEEFANEKTPDNWVTIPTFNDGTYDMGDLTAREELQAILGDAFTLLLAGKDRDLENDDVDGFLYKFTMAWVNEDGTIDKDAIFDEEDRDFIVNHFKNFQASELVVLACHKDEEDGERLYGFFVWLPGRLNRIANIFAPPAQSEADEAVERVNKELEKSSEN